MLSIFRKLMKDEKGAIATRGTRAVIDWSGADERMPGRRRLIPKSVTHAHAGYPRH